MVLQADKTKTAALRVVPVGQRLAAVLEMIRTDPLGEPLGPDTYVFGDEVGGPIGSIKTTWRTTCAKAGVVGLNFHDLRREFACRLLESRAELHDVRDFLGHTNLTTTSRYLRSTPLRLERALGLLERATGGAAPTKGLLTGRVAGKIATPLPHGGSAASGDAIAADAEVLDALEDVMVSPEGIEPSTNRLRVCCSAN